MCYIFISYFVEEEPSSDSFSVLASSPASVNGSGKRNSYWNSNMTK